MKGDTEIYDAQGEYMKQMKLESGPRNISPAKMAKIRAASLNMVMGGSDEAGIVAGFSGAILKWDTLSKLEKIEKARELEMAEVKALLGNEDDNEILLVLLNRKKELEKKG